MAPPRCEAVQPTLILLPDGICSSLLVSFRVLLSAGLTVVVDLVPVTPQLERGGFILFTDLVSRHREDRRRVRGGQCSRLLVV